MSTIVRALIKTHHMTSRKKISAITKSAFRLECSVLLKVGKPPGVMVCEGAEESVSAWIDGVKRLRYKDYQLLSRQQLAFKEGEGLAAVVRRGGVIEIERLDDFAKTLEDAGGDVLGWWKEEMRFLGKKHSEDI